MDVENLGDDLVLLSVRPDGMVPTNRLPFSLMGSELVSLAARGKVEIIDGRILVRDAAPTGDAQLDLALQSLARAKRAPRARQWVGSPRRGIAAAYLARLCGGTTLQRESRTVFGLFPVTRYRITDPGRVAEAKARLDAIARSTGPVDIQQAALGGLAHAAEISAIHYQGRANRDARTRLRQIAERKVSAAASARTAIDDAASQSAAATATDAAIRAATDAATQAAVSAATDAAVNAATEAAVHAAVHAATHAAADAGGHGGAGGGHGH